MKTVELRRHTANDGDNLTPEGIRAAVEIGRLLADRYDLLISSGAQRATQTLACFLGGSGKRFPAGVTVDPAFRSSVEDRWFAAAKQSGGGGLKAFLKADPGLVEEETARFGEALRHVFDSLPQNGRALIVGHSPMHEVAVYGLTDQIVAPISKGAGVLVGQDGGQFRLVAGPSISLGAAIPAARRALADHRAVPVPARLSLATLGVSDVRKSTAFYRALGWPLSSASVDGEVSFFNTTGGLLALWGRDALAADARLASGTGCDFRGVSLAINLDSPQQVDQAFEQVRQAGGGIVRPPTPTEWGGYSGYFADPDGHLWEVAHNPGWPIGADGRPQLPPPA